MLVRDWVCDIFFSIYLAATLLTDDELRSEARSEIARMGSCLLLGSITRRVYLLRRNCERRKYTTAVMAISSVRNILSSPIEKINRITSIPDH